MEPQKAKNQLTIVMYHYVRDYKTTLYPEIKGLDVGAFQEQLSFLSKHYAFVTMNQVLDALDCGAELPPHAVLLTFDDGYKDHFEVVLPLLQRAKVQGCFYPPAGIIENKVVLDVNKIHFILAAAKDINEVAASLMKQLSLSAKSLPKGTLEDEASYVAKYKVPNRFDPAEVNFVKKMLQVALPEAIRAPIVDRLFSQIVSRDQAEFSETLYMSIDEIRHLTQLGMHVGAHGYSHYWMDSLTADQQKTEIDLCIKFLDKVGVDLKRWTMCYPYGAYNSMLIEQLQTRDCRLGLTTEVKVAAISSAGRFALPRLDTNDLPKDATSSPNQWYC